MGIGECLDVIGRAVVIYSSPTKSPSFAVVEYKRSTANPYAIYVLSTSVHYVYI